VTGKFEVKNASKKKSGGFLSDLMPTQQNLRIQGEGQSGGEIQTTFTGGKARGGGSRGLDSFKLLLENV